MRQSIILGSLVLCHAAFLACTSDDDDPEPGTGKGGSSGQAGSPAAGRSGSGGSSAQGGSLARGGASADAGNGGEDADAGSGGAGLPGADGPADSASKNQFVHPTGDVDLGREVFRFETFGNEGFWTGVLKLPQGAVAAGLTPVQALQAGLSVDMEAVVAAFPAATVQAIAAELATDLAPARAPILNNPATTVALIEANAVIGLSARKNGAPIPLAELNGMLDITPTNIYAGESVGVTCALCHSITDGSTFELVNGGSIGSRLDGPTNHNLQIGKSLALGVNSRAIYPTLALDLEANNHGSVSRNGVGRNLISAAATEAEVDAYLNDPVLYPVGMFDDAVDGNGAPMHTTPFFRADLAAPWGSEGSIEMLQNFNNLVYTALLDPTDLLTPGGTQFMLDRGGAAGLEILENYRAIIRSLGVLPLADDPINGFPFVGRPDRVEVEVGLQAGINFEGSLIGMRVDPGMNADLNAYLNQLPAPAGVREDEPSIARGRLVFRAQCTSCHNDDQSRFVPQNIVAYNSSVDLFDEAPARPPFYPDWDGEPELALRSAVTLLGNVLAPVRDSVGTFDDKLIIVEASNRKQPRGSALPLLMDLARKPVFLHDDSVSSLDALLDPTARAAGDPHPFFIADESDRADVVAFLRSLDDQPLE